MKKNILILCFFIILDSCNCQNQYSKDCESICDVLNLLSNTSLNEQLCFTIQTEIDKLYFSNISNQEKIRVNNFIIGIDSLNEFYNDRLYTHNLSYCSPIKSKLYSLLLSSKFRDIRSEKNRFIAISDSSISNDRYMKGPYKLLLMHQANILTNEDKFNFLQDYNNDNTRWNSIDVILQSVGDTTRLDYYLFLLNLFTNEVNEMSSNYRKLLNKMKTDFNLLKYNERINYCKILQSRIDDNPKYVENIQLNILVNEIIKIEKSE